MPPNKPYNTEAGNVFLIILIGIVLFAALSFSLARGFRSETTNNLTDREAALAASDILGYAQRVERAVNKLRRNSVSENDLSFDQATAAGYNHAQPDNHKVFNTAGGAITWQEPPVGANDGTTWHFTGESCIPDLGNGDSTCATDTTANEELMIILPNVDTGVCTEINDRLNIIGIPASTQSFDATQFTGTFQDGTAISGTSAARTACFSNGGNNHFYSVLIER